jgi:plasmid stabilization system protein ParE
MPTSFVLTRQTIEDLDAIWNYIARDSQDAANRVESAIFAAFSAIARHPLIGSRRAEITPLPVRFWPVTEFPQFLVVYRPKARPVKVVAVICSKREMERLLLNR